MAAVASRQCLRWHLDVHGAVQGVGFRPFVYETARSLRLDGWVRNTSCGVEIDLSGEVLDFQAFLGALQNEAPPLARVMAVDVSVLPAAPDGVAGFFILDSRSEGGRTLISPDVATCPACRAEIFDAGARRYRYAFTNCTHCGPRFTIIRDLPYDRPRTAMRDFLLCGDCAREYADPADRRFHAQPVACPACGPELWYVGRGSTDRAEDAVGDGAIRAAVDRLNRGGIVALRGLGGFHLCCRAEDAAAVRRLRSSKFRPSKPLAVMVRTVDAARRFCRVSDVEARLLLSPEAPIVLLRKTGEDLAPEIAPGNAYLGVMLPYTPLHHLLMTDVTGPLVMTSGNPSGEPLCKDNDEALARLDPFVDGFLLHDRPIERRCDDSVVMVIGHGGKGTLQSVRRSRGFAPLPVLLPACLALPRSVLATGADLKNVSAVAADRQVFLTAHIGDLRNPRVRQEQARALGDLARLFRIAPEAVVCDLHPAYASVRFAEAEAERMGVPLVRVQHHHAHIAGCLAENGVEDRVIGLGFDGTGYGTDGQIWGGEVLVADVAHFARRFHLEYLPLPGGDAAVLKPYRTAIAYLLKLVPEHHVGQLFPEVPLHELGWLSRMVEGSVNAPLTSSAGRLFDAVSALLGLCRVVTHEAQAAVALEAEALAWEEDVSPYVFRFDGEVIRLGGVMAGVVKDIRARYPVGAIARRFHLTLADMALSAAEQVRAETGLCRVALSGGVWQNRLLLEFAANKLRDRGFDILLHHAVPANDGGVAFGQVAVAAARMQH